MVVQALSTMSLTKILDNVEARNISFIVEGVTIELSMNDISTRLGFDHFNVEGEQRFTLLEEEVRQSSWAKIARVPWRWESSRHNCTDIKDPYIRILQHILANSVYERKEVVGKVTLIDLMCFYSIVHKRMIHMGFVIVTLFRNQCNEKAVEIYIGPYITRLLRDEEFLIASAGQIKMVSTSELATKAKLTRVYAAFESHARKRSRVETQEEEHAEEEAQEEVRGNQSQEVRTS